MTFKIFISFIKENFFHISHPDLILIDSIEIRILELDIIKNTYYKNKHDKKAQ